MSPECAQTTGPGPSHTLDQVNRTHFPFFSDVKGDHRLVLSVVETTVLGLIFVVSLLGNVCALVLVARRRRRGATASLVLNLFCADLLFTSAIPLVLVVRWTEAWLLGPVVCHLLFYVMTMSGSVTILTLAAVSLERMVCIVRLRRGLSGPGRRTQAALLAFIWGYSALAALPLCILFRVVPQRLPGGDQVSAGCVQRNKYPGGLLVGGKDLTKAVGRGGGWGIVTSNNNRSWVELYPFWQTQCPILWSLISSVYPQCQVGK